MHRTTALKDRAASPRTKGAFRRNGGALLRLFSGWFQGIRLEVGAVVIAAAAAVGWVASAEGVVPDFAKGPYLQNVTESSIVVCWESDVPSDGEIEYWLEGSHTSSIVSVESGQRQEVVLGGLQPGTAYGYRVRIPSEGEGSFFAAGFRTAPVEAAAFTFVVYGDSRDNGVEFYNPRHQEVADAIRSHDPAFVVHTGDIVHSGDSDDSWNGFWQAAAPVNGEMSLTGNAPFYPSLGNHEYRVTTGGSRDEAMHKYRSFFVLPPNGLEGEYPEWSDRFYSFRYGPAFCIVVDGNRYMVGSYAPGISPGEPQHDWLIEQLEAAEKQCPFTFVFLHPSMYSSGPWGKGNASGLRYLDPLFREHGVDAVFSSHDHFYERCETYVDGYRLLYLVEGAGGAAMYSRASGWDEVGSWMWDELNQTFYTKAFDNSSTSFIKVDVVPRGSGLWRATFSAMRPNGEVIDSVQIERLTLSLEVTPGQTYQVEFSDDLADSGGGWQRLGDPVVADGPLIHITDDGRETGVSPTDDTVRRRFYRARELP